MSNYRSIDIVSAQQRTTRNTNVFYNQHTHTPSAIDKEVYEHLHIGDKKVTNK